MSGALRFSAALVCALAILGIESASASDFHGIGFLKGCASPVAVGDAYQCTFRIANTLDTAHDTIRITSLLDTIETSAGTLSTGNILGATQLVFTGPVACSGGSGAGTAASPYAGAAQCTLPFGSSIETLPFNAYTVASGDLGLPDHRLVDTGTLSWNNTCTAPSTGCDTNLRTATALASAVIGTGASQTSFHGIVFSKDCKTPAPIETAYACSMHVANAVDTAHDTIRITGVVDDVHSAGGDVSSGNLIAKARWIFGGKVTCTGGSGDGTSHRPYIGATQCLLPFGASMESEPIELYTLLPADALLAGGRVFDDAGLTWNNTCTFLAGDCTTRALFAATDTSVRVFVPAFLGLSRPLKPSYRAGHHIHLAFRLGDLSQAPLDDADAATLARSCQVTATLDGLAPQCARYDPKHNRFQLEVDTPKTLAGGVYPLTIAVGGSIVDTEQVVVKDK